MTSAERPRPVFPTMKPVAKPPADPESLFGELARQRDGVGALWSHQADQLRTYSASHTSTVDVALELPTGSGKTMVGLLIGEWRRRALTDRVVYACPTKQLARQVTAAAERQGVAAKLFIGKSSKWSAADVADYVSADSIAVTTYGAIFNTNSRFADADTLIFDGRTRARSTQRRTCELVRSEGG